MFAVLLSPLKKHAPLPMLKSSVFNFPVIPIFPLCPSKSIATAAGVLIIPDAMVVEFVLEIFTSIPFKLTAPVLAFICIFED